MLGEGIPLTFPVQGQPRDGTAAVVLGVEPGDGGHARRHREDVHPGQDAGLDERLAEDLCHKLPLDQKATRATGALGHAGVLRTPVGLKPGIGSPFLRPGQRAEEIRQAIEAALLATGVGAEERVVKGDARVQPVADPREVPYRRLGRMVYAVDAGTGKLLAKKYEGPKAQAAEKAADAAAKH